MERTDPGMLAHDKAHGFSPTRCDNHAADLNEVRKDLHGNGQEGVIVRLTRVETYLKIIVGLLLPILGVVIAQAAHVIK